MKKEAERRPAAPSTDVNVPLRMPHELHSKVNAASVQLKLAKQDVMRLSLERGIDILIAQLTSTPASAV